MLDRFSKFYSEGFTIECEEWDICRGPHQDLLKEQTQKDCKRRVYRSHLVTALCKLVSGTLGKQVGPPSFENSFASLGDALVRRRKARESGQEQWDDPLLHSGYHDLGSVSSRPSVTVRPASIWQLPELRALAMGPVYTIVFYQCALGAGSRKPTRFLTDLPDFKSLGPTGWPQLDRLARYVGPLPAHCACGRSHSGLIKRSADDAFATTVAAAYPPQLDMFIAWAIWKFAAAQSFDPASPAGGVQQMQGQKTEEEGAQSSEGTKLWRGEEEGKKQETEQKRMRTEAPKEEGRVNSVVAEAAQVSEKEIEDLIESAQRAAFAEETKGRWAPIKVYYKGRVRNLCDGLGKCSPGVRPAGHRGGEASEKARCLQWFWAEVEAVEKRMSKQERLRWISKLVLGRMESSPFGDMIEDLRRRMDEKLVELGENPKRRSTDRETPINFRRVQAWAKVVQDEDHRFLDGLMSKGVPLGVRPKRREKRTSTAGMSRRTGFRTEQITVLPSLTLRRWRL